MKRVIIISLFLTAALVLSSESISCSTSSIPHEINNSATPPEIGKQAPDFTVTNLSGKAVNLSDFLGNMVLLDFWSVECDQCNMERDLLIAAHSEHPDIQIMMVDSKDDVGTVKRFVKSIDFTLPVYTDEDMAAASAFDVHLIPETFLINKMGIIKYIQNGAFTDRAQLENVLNLISE
jgi:cytochrome c biogenesis protein CcmG/thiol:disulfide interchange protein DsbE